MSDAWSFCAPVLCAALLAGLLPATAGADGTSPDPKAGLRLVEFNADGEQRLTVSHAQVSIAEIAAEHINRIVTPFERPEIWTSSRAEIRTSGAVLYVQPSDATPVSLFITEAGHEEFAINLTLVPRSVPPVELFLDMDKGLENVLRMARAQAMALGESAPPATAEVFRTAAPRAVAAPVPRNSWLDRIKAVLTAMAIGQVPRGYTAMPPGQVPLCLDGGTFTTEFGVAQWYRGPEFELVIARVVNRGPEATFEERWCAGAGVAAVALWPSATIPGGGRAELMILRQRGQGRGLGDGRTRPSLLRAGP